VSTYAKLEKVRNPPSPLYRKGEATRIHQKLIISSPITASASKSLSAEKYEPKNPILLSPKWW
jgi:hypothetical protein